MDISIKIFKDKKDGDCVRPSLIQAPSIDKQNFEGTLKKKRRRGKSKRKITKPYMKIPWQERRKNDKPKRNNRFRKIVLAKTHAPFNNNQFLMEIHKPEPEDNLILRTPSTRTRDSSFSVDSEDNYFYSLPTDEEAYLTKEFSSVYEDAQTERLSNMSKDELIQEYLLLEAKYENLIKRTERSKSRYTDDDNDIITNKEVSFTDTDSMPTDRDITETSVESSVLGESMDQVMQRLREQEEQIHELQLANEQLKTENKHLIEKQQESTSEDSESDSSSSDSCSTSSRSVSPVQSDNNPIQIEALEKTTNGHNVDVEVPEDIEESSYPIVNGFHNPGDTEQSLPNEEN